MAEVARAWTPVVGASTIPGRMFREAVIAARDARGWTDRQLAIAASVTYSRLHEWLANDPGRPKGITSETLEKLSTTLDLVYVPRGDVRPPRAKPAPATRKSKGAK